MKTKAYLVVVLILLLAGAGTFGVLVKTGKLGSLAASTTITLTFKGTVKDADGAPLPDSKIELADEYFSNAGKTTSDASGNFKITIVQSRPAKISFVYYWVDNDFYIDPDGIQSIMLSSGSNSAISYTHNFQLVEDNGSDTNPCAGRAQSVYNGILFCIDGDASAYFNVARLSNPDYPALAEWQIIISNEIIRLRGITGLQNIPERVIIDYYKTVTSGNAFADLNTNKAVMGIMLPSWQAWNAGPSNQGKYAFIWNRITFAQIIDHEFGHLTDFFGGPIVTFQGVPQDIYSSFCRKIDPININYRCFSSFSFDFRATWKNLVGMNALTGGYASKSAQELFADMFVAEVATDKNLDEKLRYFIANFQLDDPLFYSVSSLRISKKTLFNHVGGNNLLAQNDMMYIYKFVALRIWYTRNQFFPGVVYYDLQGNLTASQISAKLTDYTTKISTGKYMDVGVVPLKLTECGHIKDNAGVSIGDATGTTRLRKSSGVFPDDSGDMFDTTGSVVIMNAPLGTEQIAVTSYSSGNTNPNNTIVSPGANKTVAVSCTGNLGFNFSNQFGSFGTGNGQFASIQDIAVDQNSGNIFAVDKTGLGANQSRVEVFDKTGRYLYQFGQSNLSDASRIAVNKNGDVFVLSNIGGVFKVIVFKNNGTYSATISLSYGARDITTDPATGALYVLVGSGKTVYVYTSNSYFRAFNIQYQANRIAINASSDIFASDVINKVVRSYDIFGNYWNEQIGPFQGVADLAIDSGNRIYVLDSISKNIQVFNSDRSFLTKFSFSDQEAIPVDLAVGSDGRVSVGYSNLETP